MKLNREKIAGNNDCESLLYVEIANLTSANRRVELPHIHQIAKVRITTTTKKTKAVNIGRESENVMQ